MNTETKQIQPAKTADGWFANQIAKFEESRFGWMAILITVQSCLGSIACMYILKQHAGDMLLASCIAITMGCNAIFIAQGSSKWCLLSFYFSVLVNFLIILIHF
jgi:hypothetical protein